MFTRHRIFTVLTALIVLLTLLIEPAGVAPASAAQTRYNITAAHSLQALNVEGASTANGARIIQWPLNAFSVPANTIWYYDAVPGTSDTYYIRSYMDDKVLSVNSYAAGAPVIQWTNQYVASQQWQEIKVATTIGTAYKYRNVATGLYLDVSGYSYKAGAQLDQWYQTGGLNQQFYISQTS